MNIFTIVLLSIFIFFAVPVRSEPAIYLHEKNNFSQVEKINDYDPSRFYIRTLTKGAFISKQESNNLVDSVYFYRVRNSSESIAAIFSIINFDAGADYIWYRWQPEQAARLNSQARIWKLATLAVMALSYYAASRYANDIARNHYTTSSSTQKRFELMRNIYYASAATTLGVYSYFTYNTYQNFGRDMDGNNLRIMERHEMPADMLPIFNESSLQQFQFTITAKFDLTGKL